METHVKRTVSSCFGTLRELRSIRRQVPNAVFQSLVVGLVLSRLDYCNGVLTGLPANLIRRLQSVENAAARLIFGIRRSEHITDALASLHWLRIPERILFKVAVLTYRALTAVYACVSVGSRALSFSDPYFHFTCLSVRHSVVLSFCWFASAQL